MAAEVWLKGLLPLQVGCAWGFAWAKGTRTEHKALGTHGVPKQGTDEAEDN